METHNKLINALANNTSLFCHKIIVLWCIPRELGCEV